MSVLKAFQDRHGVEVQAAGIVKKCSIVKSPGVLAQLMASYLDEAEKHERTLPPPDAERMPEARHSELILDGKAPLRPRVDYISEFPGVWSFGEVSEALAKLTGEVTNRPTPAHLEALKNWWLDETIKHEKKAYHLVFSMDPRLLLPLCARGIAADGVVLSAALASLMAFTARHYPGDSLGGLIGIHFDKFHPHAHALLFPRCGSGKALNLSPLSSAMVDEELTRIDFQGSLQQAFYNEAKAVEAALSLNPIDRSEEQLGQWMLVRSVAIYRQDKDANGSAQERAEQVEADPDWLCGATAIAEQFRAHFSQPRRPTQEDLAVFELTVDSHAMKLAVAAAQDARVEQLLSSAEEPGDWIERIEHELARTRALEQDLFEDARIVAHVGHSYNGLLQGKVPFFLEQDMPRIRVLPTPEELNDQCAKLLNDAAAKDAHARRPFTVEEMGRVLQCPYPMRGSSRKSAVPDTDNGEAMPPSAVPTQSGTVFEPEKDAASTATPVVGHADSGTLDDRNRSIFESIEELARDHDGRSRGAG